MPKFPQQADGLHPPKDFLDSLACALTLAVPDVASRAAINGTAAVGRRGPLRDVRGEAHVAELRDEASLVIPPVATDRQAPGRESLGHPEGGIHFRVAVRPA